MLKTDRDYMFKIEELTSAITKLEESANRQREENAKLDRVGDFYETLC